MAITIDGSTNKGGSTVTSLALTLSTSKTNDIILVAVHSERGSTPHATVSAVSDTAGLTWAKRSSLTLDSSTFNDAEVWWALSTGKLTSDVITVTFDRTVDNASAIAFGVNGATTSGPWDANVSLPASATATSSSVPTVTGISTTTVNDMVLGFYFAPSFFAETTGTVAGAAAASINTGVAGNSITQAEYAVVTAALSSASASYGGNSTTWLMIADALTPSRAPVVYNDSITESVAASDSLANTMTMAATISDSVVAHDSQTNGSVYLNSISEGVAPTDSMAASVSQNGWTQQPPSGGTWTKVKPSSSGTWTKVNPSGGTWTKH